MLEKLLPPIDINRGHFSSYMIKAQNYEHIRLYKREKTSTRNGEHYPSVD